MADWLQSNGISYLIPHVLPSDMYADASHPLGTGYALLAEQLFEDEDFRAFDGRAKRAGATSSLDASGATGYVTAPLSLPARRHGSHRRTVQSSRTGSS
jgi:hypothetical protein